MKAIKVGEWVKKHQKGMWIVFCVFVVLYMYSMVLHPWVAGGGNFGYVQRVWDRWQGFNVGVLAFVSSYIIFLAATNRDETKRERTFRAEKALLPHALSEITHYLESCIKFINEAKYQINSLRAEKNLERPSLPQEYRIIFKNCIESADDDTGDYLAGIIARLQINNSRLKSLEEAIRYNEHEMLKNRRIQSHICDVAEINAMVSNLYDFSRSLGYYKEEWFTKDAIVNSLRALNVDLEQYGNNVDSIEYMLRKKGMMNK